MRWSSAPWPGSATGDLVIGVDRLDYSKGIVERLESFERFLIANPDRRGHVVLLQIAPHSRSEVPEYEQLDRQTDAALGRINSSLGDPSWTPIRFIKQAYTRPVLAGLYRHAAVGLVTPMRDGMNLVAKEYVAAQRPDDPGVLVLSRFAGAAEQMKDAVIVNPYDKLRLTRQRRLTDAKGYAHLARAGACAGQAVRRGARCPLPLDHGRGRRTGPRMTDLTTSRAPSRPSPHPAPGFAVFLDFDGTLVDIAARPDWVRIDPALLDVLERLRQRLDGALAIVTGRSLAVLDDLLAPCRFDASGLHGAECRIRERTWRGPAVPAPLGRVVDELERRFGSAQGMIVEDKGQTVSLHWREAPERAEDGLAAMAAIVAELGGGYRLQRGKAVAEIVPAGASKGVAISQFLAAAPYHGRCPVFIGDDLTDEHGFEVVNAKGGLSVHVGAGPSRARFRLGSPAEVRAELLRWADGAPIGFRSTLAFPNNLSEPT